MIKLFRYLFGAINCRIITVLGTVYHFIAIFRYINNLPEKLIEMICFTSSSQFKQKICNFLLCIQFYSALMDHFKRHIFL